MSQGWIAVDLDGTLALYDHAHFPKIGPPIPKMLNRVKGWLSAGRDVRIFTARVGVVPGLRNDAGQEADLSFAADQELAIQNWCEEHLGVILPVTCQKDFQMIELWDDRCVQVVPNTGMTLAEDLLLRAVACGVDRVEFDSHG